MTIDEAIEKSKELASTYRIAAKNAENIFISKLMQETKRKIYIKLAEEHEQLAEWLEELKAYREIGTIEECKNAIDCYTEEYARRKSNEQYNKAIDDFIHECDKHCGFYNGKNKSITREDILKIAEKLKTYGYAKD